MILPECRLQYEYRRNIPIELFPEIRDVYIVSNYGYIYNLETGNYLPQATYFDNNDYVSVHLSKRNGGFYSTSMHRVILMTFNYIDGCENLDVNHKDGIKYHNWLWNLEWTTHKENMNHAFSNNLISYGEDRNNSVLNNYQIREICKLIEAGYSTKDICEKLKYDNCNLRRIICNIKSGLSWSFISSEYDFSNAYKNTPLLNNDQIHFICSYYQNNGKNSIIAKDLLSLIGIDMNLMNDKEKLCYETCISSIKHKKNFKEICNQYDY